MNAVVPVVNIWLRNYRTEIFYREKLKRLENMATVIKFSVVVVVVVVPDLVPACFCRETSSFGRENVAKSCFGKSASVSYCEKGLFVVVPIITVAGPVVGVGVVGSFSKQT